MTRERRAASPTADRTAGRSVLRVFALTVAASVTCVVAGAALAAPDRVAPLARAGFNGLVLHAEPLLRDAMSAAGSLWTGARTTVAGMSLSDLSLADASPRTLAMMMAGALSVLFAAAALWHARRERSMPSSATRRDIRRPRSTRTDRTDRAELAHTPGAGVSARIASGPRSLLGAPRRSASRGSALRSAAGRPTPKQVHALAAQGTPLADIARCTGLSMDAISLLLAVATNNG